MHMTYLKPIKVYAELQVYLSEPMLKKQMYVNIPVGGGSCYQHLVPMGELALRNNQKEKVITVRRVKEIAPFLN